MNGSSELDEARRRWTDDRPRFGEFGTVLEKRCRTGLLGIGVLAVVSSRAKETASLIKKLMVRSDYTYETLPDKAGVRIIVRFQREVLPVLDLAALVFSRGAVDYKANDLGDDRVGYVSAHADIALRPEDPDAANYDPGQFHAELQVRTSAQHLWSEMAHDTVYKSAGPVSIDIRRRTNLMAGLIEVADSEFSRIDDELRSKPGAEEAYILKALEQQFFKLCARQTNPELSLAIIQLLGPLYQGARAWDTHFQDLFAKSEQLLRHVFDRAEQAPELHSPLLFQPEALMVYDLLKSTPWTVRKVWNQRFPDSELEHLANEFGEVLD